MSEVSYLRFTLLNLIGAAIRATAIGLTGFYFGQEVEALLGDIKHYEVELMASIVAIAILIWVVNTFLQRRKARATPRSFR